MTIKLHHGDCLDILKTIPDESIHCVVTSPPYWGLRDYGIEGQLGLEATPEEHCLAMVDVFREVRRVLRGDGTLWLNYGDSYASGVTGRNEKDRRDHRGVPYGNTQESQRGRATGCKSGLKPKDLVGMPWRVAFALQHDGWWLRSDIIWAKPNPMPESVTDRPTKSHEHMFLLAKSAKYYYDAESVKQRVGEQTRRQKTFRGGCYTNNSSFDNSIDYSGHDPYSDDEPSKNGRNLRDVWTIATQPYPKAHFATFPTKFVEPCIKAGCPEDGTVLDPFGGAGTVGLVADRLGRDAILIELNEEYVALAKRRIYEDCPMFARVESC